MPRNHRKHKPWKEYPLRTCYTMHECCYCQDTIKMGQEYYDGGYDLRIHKTCVCERCGEAKLPGHDHWHGETDII